jgi:hypothetical protein
MQIRLATDQPPVSHNAAVPLGTGRLAAALTSTGPQTALTLNHAAASESLATCEMNLDLSPADAWRGELNAEMAIFTEEFNSDGQRIVRETIAHLACDLIVVRTVAEQPFAGELGWSGIDGALAVNNRISVAARDATGIPWQGELRVHLADGDLAATEDGKLAFRNTHEIVCEISLGYGDKGRAGVECGSHRISGIDGWDQLVQQHVDLWRQHFGGLVGTITGKDPAPFISQRLQLLASGKNDPRLYYALWQASRYQLCALHATAPPIPPGAVSDWLGLLPSGLPAYLNQRLEAAYTDSSPSRQLAVDLKASYFPIENTSLVTNDRIDAHLPDTSAAAVWRATVARDPEALAVAVKAVLTDNDFPWLATARDAGILAAAFPAMLVQAEDAALRLCPCLPPSWVQGAAHGLLAPGGWTLSLEWSMSRPTKVVIAGNPAGICELRNLPDEYTLVDDHEKAVPFTQDGDVITFTARSRQAYFLQRQKIR